MVPTKDTTLTVNLVGEKLSPPLWFSKIYPTVLVGEEPEEAVFDEAWHGPIVFRWPTINDQAAIAGKISLFAQRSGFEQAGHLPDLTFLLAQALFFFEHLAVKGHAQPAWLALDAVVTPLQQLAILRAHELAQAQLVDEKKSSKPAGSTASTA